MNDQLEEEAILQISGAGHWFLEGWIGDHSVDFLVDSGSAVTAVSCSFYKALAKAGAPVGVLRPTLRKLRGANGSQIDILGCSSCVVSFLGLRTEFPILVCDLSIDVIIGTYTLGSVLPHTLDIKHGLLFTEGGVSLQLHRRDAVRTRVYRGALFDSAVLGGGPSLYHSHGGWPVDAAQWPVGGPDSFF